MIWKFYASLFCLMGPWVYITLFCCFHWDNNLSRQNGAPKCFPPIFLSISSLSITSLLKKLKWSEKFSNFKSWRRKKQVWSEVKCFTHSCSARWNFIFKLDNATAEAGVAATWWLGSSRGTALINVKCPQDFRPGLVPLHHCFWVLKVQELTRLYHIEN